jgi:hypothetical protein
VAGLTDFDGYVADHGIPREHYQGRVHTLDRPGHRRAGAAVEKVEREPPADGVVIEGDDL